MKKLIQLHLLLFIFLLASACKKEEVLSQTDSRVVKVQLKGYVMTDTLEFVVNGKIMGKAIDNSFTLEGSENDGTLLFKTGDKILVRKKVNGNTVGTLNVAESPYNQVKKIFYDGSTLTDHLELTPVSDPNNMGLRFRFSSDFVDFYGGPVDIEILEQVNVTKPPRSTTYNSVRLLQGVTGAFGDFIELPPLLPETGKNKQYVFKVYKTGTKDLPYASMTNILISDLENNFGYFDWGFVAGGSMLISISPVIYEDVPRAVGDGYSASDFSSAFQ